MDALGHVTKTLPYFALTTLMTAPDLIDTLNRVRNANVSVDSDSAEAACMMNDHRRQFTIQNATSRKLAKITKRGKFVFALPFALIFLTAVRGLIGKSIGSKPDTWKQEGLRIGAVVVLTYVYSKVVVHPSTL